MPLFFFQEDNMTETFVGILHQEDRNGRVVLDRPDPRFGREIVIAARDLNGAPTGMRVVCSVTGLDALSAGQLPRGRIIEVLGDPSRPDVAILSILRDHGLSEQFPQPVLDQAATYGTDPETEGIAAELARGRRDLRSQRLITIDGEDARDLDDAVNVEALPDGRFRLGVHIADVSHYVIEGSPLDREAQRRGTSVYLADRVIPMLPPRLSNGICSLNPDRDRLTLSAVMIIDPQGTIEAGEVFESVIRSQARATYTEVRQALETQTVPPDRSPEFLDDLRLMQRLASILGHNRANRGSIEFEFPETHVVLDDEGKPLAVEAYPISFANSIIEEFMIAANEFIACKFYQLKLPFLYRVHELPDPDKLRRFLRLAGILGVKVRLHGAPTPAQLAQVLAQVKEEPFGITLAELLLRSLAKARYSAVNLGHFGLASEFYCHFTSPIRRYPDLFIHRVIKASLQGDVPIKRWLAAAPVVAEHSSDMEREAMQAERDSVAQKAAEYMVDHLGETFAGVISGFSSAGLYVRLDSTIEGMVPYRTMPGYLVYDEERMQAADSANRRTYNLGDAVQVQVARADTILRRIDFELKTWRDQPLEQAVAAGPRPGKPKGVNWQQDIQKGRVKKTTARGRKPSRKKKK